jgi:uncharacterized protein (TIGR00730 family)
MNVIRDSAAAAVVGHYSLSISFYFFREEGKSAVVKKRTRSAECVAELSRTLPDKHSIMIKRICVFCGSNPGFSDSYKKAAFSLGEILAINDIGLVYGGASVGLMGLVADGALSKGGKVVGVLPRFLRDLELQHNGLTDLILVESMHDRKTKMNELSDGVIALPGGYGTLEEFFEILTWAQLGLHQKPMGLLNVNGFYNHLLSMVQHMVIEGFLKKDNSAMILSSADPEDLLRQMFSYSATSHGKWMNEKQT